MQADIDVIGNGDLPDHYEVELPLVMVSALERLREFGLPKATVHANNRKLSEGFYRGLGLTDIEGVLREIDKLDKIGADEVAKLLVEGCGADEAQARACLELAELTAADGKELSDKFDALCAKHDIASDSDAYVLARQGLDTLAMIVDEAARIRPGSVIADLKIARGLDYYTGSVYETFLDGAAALGSICSGGRYDNLASQGNKKYPGVGLSIGLSRLVSYMLHAAGAHANRVSPASVLVAVWNEADRSASNLIASRSNMQTSSASRTSGSRPTLPKRAPRTKSRTSSQETSGRLTHSRGSRILCMPSKPLPLKPEIARLRNIQEDKE